MDNKSIDRALIFGGIGILFILTFFVLKPLIVPMILAFIFGYVCVPAYKGLKRRIKLESLSAIIIICALIALLIVPLGFLMPALTKQTFNLYLKVQDVNLGASLQSLLPSSISPELARAINLQTNSILSKLFSSIMNEFSEFISDLPSLLLKVTIFLFIFYFVLIDFDKIGKALAEFVPLSKENSNRFAREFRNVTEGILYGQILLGILQGVMMGLMMFILGIEGTLLLTIVAIIAGVLPMIGPTIVWIPLGIILIINGHPIQAIILAVWGMFVSAITDGLLRPYILSKRSLIPVAWGFIGTIGGLYAFGLVGLILGPLIIAYVIIILQFYKQKRFNELFKS